MYRSDPFTAGSKCISTMFGVCICVGSMRTDDRFVQASARTSSIDSVNMFSNCAMSVPMSRP